MSGSGGTLLPMSDQPPQDPLHGALIDPSLPAGYAGQQQGQQGGGEQVAQPAQEYSMRMDPDVAVGEYANYVQIRFNSIEMVLDFSRLIPDLNAIQLVSRVLISPALAKSLAESLKMNVDAFEREFGAGKPKIATIGPRTEIGFRTSQDLAQEGIIVPARPPIRLPSDPSKAGK